MRYFLLILFGITPCILFAGAGNEKLLTKLTSNSAICTTKNNENICTYIGDAKFNQGSTDLRADQIAVYKTTNSKINKIVAYGKHSHYSNVVDGGKKSVNADADLITVHLDRDMMILEGNGQVIAGQDKYSGPYIEYQFK